MTTLVHFVEGRLRIRVPKIKDDPAAAASLKDALTTIDGVEKVRANTAAGSVVIRYDPWRINHGEFMDLFGIQAAEGPRNASLATERPCRAAHSGPESLNMASLGHTVVRVAVETACVMLFRRLLAGMRV